MKKMAVFVAIISTLMLCSCASEETEKTTTKDETTTVTTTTISTTTSVTDKTTSETEEVLTTPDNNYSDDDISVSVDDTIEFLDFDYFVEKIQAVVENEEKYIIPELDSDRFEFEKGVFYPVPKGYKFYLKDTEDDKTIIFTSYVRDYFFNDYDEFYEYSNGNATMPATIVDRTDLNGFFVKWGDDKEEYFFMGYNDDGLEYNIEITNLEKSTIENLEEIIIEFEL